MLASSFQPGLGRRRPEAIIVWTSPAAGRPEHHQRQKYTTTQLHKPNSQSIAMSMFGLGRPQPSSAEKIAAAEQEMDLVTDMFNK